MEFLRRKEKRQDEQRHPNLMAGQDGYTFRRSRTLTGSASSGVNAVAQQDRSHLTSPRLKLHQLQRHQRGVVVALLISILAVVNLGWMVGQYINTPEEFTYTQRMNDQPDTLRYKKAIEEYFDIRPTERFLFKLDQQRLSAFVSERHPEVEKVAVASSTPGLFDVEVYFREPVLAWQSGDSHLYVDKHGVAFHENYFLEPHVAVDDQSGIKLDNSNLVASGRFIEFLGQVVSSVSATGLKVDKVIIPMGTTRQVDIKLESYPYPIKTHIDREPMSQAQDIANAVKHLDGKRVTPEYIDVRVAGKAFYR